MNALAKTVKKLKLKSMTLGEMSSALPVKVKKEVKKVTKKSRKGGAAGLDDVIAVGALVLANEALKERKTVKKGGNKSYRRRTSNKYSRKNNQNNQKETA